ncbi:hypothetical protein D3C81_1301100 [compost metagenome]
MNQCALTTTGAAEAEQVGPHGKEGFRDCGGVHPVQTVWNRQGLAGGDGAVFGITTAVGQRADFVAHGELIDTRPERHDFTGDLQPGNRVHAGFHRVFAGTLQGVRPVDSGGVYADQHLAFCDSWKRHAFGLQDVGATGFADFDSGHFVGQGHIDSCWHKFCRWERAVQAMIPFNLHSSATQ